MSASTNTTIGIANGCHAIPGPHPHADWVLPFAVIAAFVLYRLVRERL